MDLRNTSGRVRDILRRAAKEAPSAASWLQRDELGTWEKHVREYMARAEEHPLRSTLTVEQVDAEIAQVIAGLALEALLRDAQRNEGAPKRRGKGQKS